DAGVRAAAPLLRRVLGPDRRLRLHLGAGEAAVLLDPLALDRILLNLVTNAAAALPPDGSLVVSTSAGSDDAVLIEARDNGPGFDAAILPHLFSPYATTRRGAGGTGLGLASVRALVQAAGGRVTADNAPGGGARLCI
ncbi:ATP-binding protein, partial [Acidisphaera rubrifaciens]|uniref:ATP-binding protein n=1 Tax=Acidisphaera rubrifaciens TaxID=50715 RepID=UPI00066261AD